jgi:hypothetical protein
MKTCIEKGLTFGPMIEFSIATMLQVLCQAVSGPEIDY